MDIEEDIKILEEYIEEFKEEPKLVLDIKGLRRDIEVQAIEHLLQAYKKQEKQIDKLKNKNSELLRKLRNRVKEVNKLTKYSNYKKEFTTLNNRIKEQEQVIDEMITQLCELKGLRGIDEEDCFIPIEYSDINDCLKISSCNLCIKQYFINKVKGE